VVTVILSDVFQWSRTHIIHLKGHHLISETCVHEKGRMASLFICDLFVSHSLKIVKCYVLCILDLLEFCCIFDNTCGRNSTTDM
jgi:hypothetical protein